MEKHNRKMVSLLVAFTMLFTFFIPFGTFTVLADEEVIGADVPSAPLTIFNNGKLKFGVGDQDSVNQQGSLLQPFYYDSELSGGGWFKLTYASYPLNSALGVGGDGTNEWNRNGDILVDETLADQLIDTSHYTSTSDKGYGTIISTGKININGQLVEVKNTYTLGENASFIKIVTKVTNKDVAQLTNVRYWVGTQDDWIGITDGPSKVRGNIVDGAFVKLQNQSSRSSALKIFSNNTGVLFYSTSPRAMTSIKKGFDEFTNTISINPSQSLVETAGDDCYSMYIRLNDLNPNESDEFTWYYAAGELDKLGDITQDVGNAAEQETPQITAPGAPTNVTATAGDGQATVSFTAPEIDGGSPITTYTVTSNPGGITAQSTTSPIIVLNLTTDSVYTFTVTARNAAGESASSSPSNAVTPIRIPTDSEYVDADEAGLAIGYAAGDSETSVTQNVSLLQAGVNGSRITWSSDKPEIISSSGDVIRPSGADTLVTLTATITKNGETRTKTFIVKVLKKPSTSSGSSSTPVITPLATNTADVEVNGKKEAIGTTNTASEGNQTVTTITLDEKKLESKLQSEDKNAVVTIQVSKAADVIVGELNGQMVKNMETKEAILEIKTDNASYTLPARQINIDAISAQVGKDIALKGIKVTVEIAKPAAETAKVVENAEAKGEFTIVAEPVEFNVRCTYGGQTVEVKQFNSYVERTIAIPEGIDPNKITTGIVVDPDGGVRHVPTKVVLIDGKYYAKINSLTNSTYSVVWHPLTFTDVDSHWAKEAVNDMGSRMIINGVGENKFDPDRDITRGEFAAIIVKALGLKPGTGTNPFNDVQASDWYAASIETATQYNIISGYGKGKFGPKDKITREQAMSMIARAMKLTGLKEELQGKEMQKLLAAFGDASKASEYAKASIAACIKAGIADSKEGNMSQVKGNITRAEVAVIVRRLLQKSELI